MFSWLSARARFWFCLFRPRHEHKVSHRQSVEERVQRIHRSPRGDNGPAAAAPARPAGGSRRVPAGPGPLHHAQTPAASTQLRVPLQELFGVFCGLWAARPGSARPAPGELVAGLCVCVCECVRLLPFFLRGLACFRLLQRGPSAMISCFIDK